ncbi:MAG: hypothetical protein CMD02_02180 [Flavobacteriales bacterium]|nr:hypothetical protein [Flavobacteriales bacterium]
MKKLKYILLFSLLQTFVSAQNVIRVCEGDTAQNFAVNPTLGSTYNWTLGTQSIATIVSGNGSEHILLDLNTSGVFWLHVQETDSNLCSSKDSILIEVFPKPNPFIYSIGNNTLCQEDSMTLFSDSVYNTLLWSNGLNSDSIKVYESDSYYLTVTDTNGCSNISNSIDVYFNPKPNADFFIDGVCFENKSIFTDFSTVSSGSIASWLWDFGDGNYDTGPSVSHLYQHTDLFNISLFVKTDAGCEDSLSKNLQIFHVPKAEFEFYPFSASTLSPEISFFNMSENALPILWNFGDGRDTTIENPIHVFSEPGNYEVKLYVSDTNNCFDSVSHNITVYYDFILYVPNSFTPNIDGNNDLFLPKGLRMEKYQSYEFTIFDRWGEEIFRTNKISEGWNGENVISGKYTWVIIITDELGELRKKVGEVMLIK